MNRMISPCRLLDFLEDGLEPLLELAAVLGPGDQRAHVQGDDAAVLQPLGHVAADDPRRQSLDDGRLADAGLADQHGVVLGAPRQHLDDAADLLVPADDRIELVLPGHLRQVAAVLLQRLVGRLGVLRGDALAAAHLAQRRHASCRARARLAEQAAGRPGVIEQCQEEVFDGDVFVLERLGLVLGLDQDAVERGPGMRLIAAAGHFGQALHLAVEAVAQGVDVQAGLPEDGGDDAAVLLEQGLQQVFALDLLLAVASGQLLGRQDRLPGPSR